MKSKLILSFVLCGAMVFAVGCTNSATNEPTTEAVQSTPVQSEDFEVEIGELAEANDGNSILDSLVSVQMDSKSVGATNDGETILDYSKYCSKNPDGKYIFYSKDTQSEMFINPEGMYVIEADGEKAEYKASSEEYKKSYDQIQASLPDIVYTKEKVGKETVISAKKYGEMARVTTSWVIDSTMPEIYELLKEGWNIEAESVEAETEYDVNADTLVADAMRSYIYIDGVRTQISDASYVYSNDIRLSEAMEEYSNLPIE